MELPQRLIERTGYLERIKPFMRKNIANYEGIVHYPIRQFLTTF